jgi:hypothetical protein
VSGDGELGEIVGEQGRLDCQKDEAVLDHSPEQLASGVKQELEGKGVRCYERFVETEGLRGVGTGTSRPELSRGGRMRHKDFEAMQGASRQAVNAEEMLAELKRVVEASKPLPVRPPNASMLPKSDLLVRRAQPEKESERRIQATGDNSAESGQPTVPRKPTTPIARSWKLAAAGLVLAGAAMIGATFAFINRAPDLPKREFAVVATEAPVRPQSGGQTVEPSSSAGPPMQDSRPTEPSQVGALETRPDAMTAPARSTSGGEAIADAPPQSGSFGLESVAPAFAPAPANPAPAPAATQTATQDGASTATAPSAPASTGSALTAARTKPPANATATASVSAEAAQPSTPKIDSATKPPRRSSLQRPVKRAKASATPVAQAERRSPRAPPNEAESAPSAAQGVGNPTPVATSAPATIQQRFADGLTGAFGYVVHLPGALLPHPADPNVDANRSGPQ